MKIDAEGAQAGLVARLADFTGMRVLEVGSGDGHMTSMLTGQAISVLGLDPDGEAIARAVEWSAESAVTNVEFRVGDICTIELVPGEFEAVFLAGSL